MESFVSILLIAEGALASSPYCTDGKCYEVVSNSRTRNSAASQCHSDRKICILHKHEFILGLLPQANEVCEGNVFTPVCDSVHRGVTPPR